eukprot:7228502-Pyramimonas_sp.AAC.1
MLLCIPTGIPIDVICRTFAERARVGSKNAALSSTVGFCRWLSELVVTGLKRCAPCSSSFAARRHDASIMVQHLSNRYLRENAHVMLICNALLYTYACKGTILL